MKPSRLPATPSSRTSMRLNRLPATSQFPSINAGTFNQAVLNWFDIHGRKDLPWQHNPSPYRVWVSEIMLQQTQVQTVIPYFERMLTRFPSLESLANAPLDQVLHLWTGLGYYARARNLHKTAIIVRDNFHGELPRSVEQLQNLPGIGRSTAGAIAALSMNLRAPILDGNVKRVLTRHFAVAGWPEQSRVKNRLWDIAEQLTPTQRVADYTQAMMDLGAGLCTRSNPACETCPLMASCAAYNSATVSLYPGRKPGKALPVTSTAMYILRNTNDAVLLEKRPPTGIWGSLYSLPEGDPAATKADIGHHSFPLGNARVLESISHSFSHYQLKITPIHLKPHKKMEQVAENDRWLWYPLDHSLEVGLAAPVKRILDSLDKSELP